MKSEFFKGVSLMSHCKGILFGLGSFYTKGWRSPEIIHVSRDPVKRQRLRNPQGTEILGSPAAQAVGVHVGLVCTVLLSSVCI